MFVYSLFVSTDFVEDWFLQFFINDHRDLVRIKKSVSLHLDDVYRKIKDMFSCFKQSAPVNDKPWLIVALNSMIVAFVLALFEPFQYRLNSIGQLWVLVGFVILTFIFSVVAFVLLPRLCPTFYDPDRWTVGKNVLHYTTFLLSMGVVCFIYDYIFLSGYTSSEYWNANFFHVFYLDMLASVSLGIIPTSIVLFIHQNSALKRNLREAYKLNQLLAERMKTDHETNSDMLVLSGETKDTVSVHPENLLYLEASGNYVDVCYKEETEKHKLLRTTIKQMEELLLPYKSFVRCHRAYIVNMNQVSTVSGNAQGYRLSLTDTRQEIPVSRTYMKGLKDILN